MVRVGILGSVGIGKSYVANIFREIGFNIFSADNEVANIYRNNKIVNKKINVVDIVYNPENTGFLRDARKNGHKTFTGLNMFIYQAQKAFYIWNKKNPKITKDIYKKLRKKIND